MPEMWMIKFIRLPKKSPKSKYINFKIQHTKYLIANFAASQVSIQINNKKYTYNTKRKAKAASTVNIRKEEITTNKRTKTFNQMVSSDSLQNFAHKLTVHSL